MQAECLRLGRGECSGVVCIDAAGARGATAAEQRRWNCTVRSGAQLLPSTSGETTFSPSPNCFDGIAYTQDSAWDLVNRSHPDPYDTSFYDDVWGGLEQGVPGAFIEPLALYECGDVELCIGKQSKELMQEAGVADCVCLK